MLLLILLHLLLLSLTLLNAVAIACGHGEEYRDETLANGPSETIMFENSVQVVDVVVVSYLPPLVTQEGYFAKLGSKFFTCQRILMLLKSRGSPHCLCLLLLLLLVLSS